MEDDKSLTKFVYESASITTFVGIQINIWCHLWTLLCLDPPHFILHINPLFYAVLIVSIQEVNVLQRWETAAVSNLELSVRNNVFFLYIALWEIVSINTMTRNEQL